MLDQVAFEGCSLSIKQLSFKPKKPIVYVCKRIQSIPQNYLLHNMKSKNKVVLGKRTYSHDDNDNMKEFVLKLKMVLIRIRRRGRHLTKTTS